MDEEAVALGSAQMEGEMLSAPRSNLPQPVWTPVSIFFILFYFSSAVPHTWEVFLKHQL